MAVKNKPAYTPLVSCIIPVYNAQKYLRQAMDSLLNQTYQNIEIILVDDVSTDKSWNICLDYAKKYDKIRVFKSTKNSGGPLRGRERGIHEAYGDWITFIDCDDYVLPTYIEHLIEATEHGKYDIAVTGHSRLYPDGRIEDFLHSEYEYAQTRNERLLSVYDDFINGKKHHNPANTVGQNIIRASIAKKTDLSKYSNTIYHEDFVMALAFLSNSKKGVHFVDHHDFVWRQVDGSVSHGGRRTLSKDDFFEACFDIFHKTGVYEIVSAKQPLVSVIIPVYNVEKYIDACIRSVIEQTYRNIEIILVDDKSPDGSGKKCDAWAEKDNRIKVIHKPVNEGLNMARATGFGKSAGEYIVFLDSDDLLIKDNIWRSLVTLVDSRSDVVAYGFAEFSDRDDINTDAIEPSETSKQVRQLDAKDAIAKYAFFGDNGPLGSRPMNVWGKLFRRKIVEKVDWYAANYRTHEDNFWTPQALLIADKVTILPRVLLLYRRNAPRGVASKTLSGQLRGNLWNGEPIGYLEIIERITHYHTELSKKYKLYDILKNRLKERHYVLMSGRVNNLINANLLGEENNLQYFAAFWQEHQRRDTEYVNSAEQRIAALQNELIEHLGIKRSLRLAAGNIKRRIKKVRGL